MNLDMTFADYERRIFTGCIEEIKKVRQDISNAIIAQGRRTPFRGVCSVRLRYFTYCNDLLRHVGELK